MLPLNITNSKFFLKFKIKSAVNWAFSFLSNK